jgi:anti-sigma B factor antagonist
VTEEPIVVDGHGGVAVIRVQGEHDVATAPALRGVVLDAIDGARPVVVDLSGATFIDSSVLSVLLSGLRRSREAERGYVLVLPAADGAPVRRVFEVTGLIPVFATRPSAAAAAAAATEGTNA